MRWRKDREEKVEDKERERELEDTRKLGKRRAVTFLVSSLTFGITLSRLFHFSFNLLGAKQNPPKTKLHKFVLDEGHRKRGKSR